MRIRVGGREIPVVQASARDFDQLARGHRDLHTTTLLAQRERPAGRGASAEPVDAVDDRQVKGRVPCVLKQSSGVWTVGHGQRA